MVRNVPSAYNNRQCMETCKDREGYFHSSMTWSDSVKYDMVRVGQAWYLPSQSGMTWSKSVKHDKVRFSEA